MGRMMILMLGVLAISGAVAKATNQTAVTPGDRHLNHYLDVRERLDHLEDKLDAATCKLDKQQSEITEKVHSYEKFLGDKMEILELKIERTLRVEMDRILSMMNLNHAERHLEKYNVDQDAMEPKPGGGGPLVSQNGTNSFLCDVPPAIERRLQSLAHFTDACAKASEVVQESNPAGGLQNNHKGSPHEWITIMRRVNGRVNFSCDWDEYKSGFGDLGGEFWIGLEDIYQLTSRRSHRLRVVLTDYSGEVKFAEYSNFFIRSEEMKYQIQVTGYVKGSTAGDSLALHNGMYFSTQDKDNDKADGACAAGQRGGWWYNKCDYSHLTGRYLPEGDRSDKGIAWYHAYDDNRSFMAAEMSIRES